MAPLFYLIDPPLDDHVEYINAVLAVSCEDFLDFMWNPTHPIWRSLMVREEMHDYRIVNGSLDSAANIELERQMHVPLAPARATQHIRVTSEKNKSFVTRQLYTITDNMPMSDQFDVCERWDVIGLNSKRCQVRMSGRAVWHPTWHLMMGMINGMVSDTFNQCRINFIEGEFMLLSPRTKVALRNDGTQTANSKFLANKLTSFLYVTYSPETTKSPVVNIWHSNWKKKQDTKVGLVSLRESLSF